MRLQGWEGRLAALIEAARERPYRLGEHDCFRLACAVVEALTGVDRWAAFVGRYATRREALRVLAMYGRSFDEAAAWFFDSPAWPMAVARRGDIAKFVSSGEPHLGVVVGGRVAVLAEEGLIFIPRSACAHCWKVG